MRTSLVEDALRAAASTRGGSQAMAGAVFHSDHGSAVHTSKDYAKLCGALGVVQSMGAVGTSADNALAESFNAILKREVGESPTWCGHCTTDAAANGRSGDRMRSSITRSPTHPPVTGPGVVAAWRPRTPRR